MAAAMPSNRAATGKEPLSYLVMTEPGASSYRSLGKETLERYGNVRLLDWSQDLTKAQRHAVFDAALPDTDAVVSGPWSTRMPPFTPERWAKARRLKVIAGTYDNRFSDWLDITDAQERGVTVIDTSRSMTPTVAEFALAMTLNLLRDIPAAIELVRQGDWKREPWDQPGFVYGDLTGRRVGLAGYGSISRRYAELLAPFRCSVQAYDPFVSDAVLDAFGVGRAGSLIELAAGCEIFMVGIPPTPATQGIIDREVIDALPTGAAFLLVTRMAVLEQEALWRRTEAGEIRAAVDVFAPEPPSTQATFRRSRHVLPTPHIAGDARYCHDRCFTTACEDAVAVLMGREPRYAVSVRDERLYQGRLAE